MYDFQRSLRSVLWKIGAEIIFPMSSAMSLSLKQAIFVSGD
ncbi:hypothetical Protein YC6258_01923 [Gynuella sunshinyii YC6258]|uniref:Uncharacterized protein n=1 Tax=Gynuella sunshinyii YC6258 TaxID=1445510 RepID=A0A0C5VH51_9GAMM|nr:hypothetical Protein YC6258_01923 [Gynuella sunshinyii YC6258]